MSKKRNKSRQEVKTEIVEEDEPIVYLGYIEADDRIEHELGELTVPNDVNEAGPSKQAVDDQAIKPWLVNKIGGLPIFPNEGVDIVELETILNSLKCKHCKSDCVLIFQINSPVDDSPLDRVIQIYNCVKNDCIKHSWYSLRCMFKNINSKIETKTETCDGKLSSSILESVTSSVYGDVLVCRSKAFFKPYYLSVIEEPTGKENFAKNNLEALKLASKFNDPDLKPPPIAEKYKNVKNYQPPKPTANLSDLDDFEKFQMELLYGNDKDMYRFYKRIGRYQAQIVRYDWEGKPLLNTNKIKLDVKACPSCSSKRSFELQLMSALINYMKTQNEFDKESQDFSSIIVHSCANNCSHKTFNVEDTYFMPDPDSRVFNKVKAKMIALKISDQGAGVKEEKGDENTVDNKG